MAKGNAALAALVTQAPEDDDNAGDETTATPLDTVEKRHQLEAEHGKDSKARQLCQCLRGKRTGELRLAAVMPSSPQDEEPPVKVAASSLPPAANAEGGAQAPTPSASSQAGGYASPVVIGASRRQPLVAAEGAAVLPIPAHKEQQTNSPRPLGAQLLAKESLLGPQEGANVGRKTLVLDLDETLVHSSFRVVPSAEIFITVEIEGEHLKIYVRKRPGVDEFMVRVAELYEVVVYTASMAKYANPLLDELDTKGVVSWRLFREACAGAGYRSCTPSRPLTTSRWS